MEHLDNIVWVATLGLLVVVVVLAAIFLIYKSVIFLGDSITDWWDDRKGVVRGPSM